MVNVSIYYNACEYNGSPDNNYDGYVDSTVCQNAVPVVWNGITFGGTGSYDSVGTLRSGGVRTTGATVVTDSVRLTGRGGIDSLVVMVVTILDTASVVETLAACDSIRWQDSITYHMSTTSPRLVLTGANGCDSVTHLDLTIHTTHYYVDHQMACDSMQWIDGRWYYRDTTYGGAWAVVGGLTTGPVDTLRTAEGCDSIVALDLRVHHATFEETVDTFCYNQPYSWRHHSIAASTTEEYRTVDFYLTDKLRTIWDCDSVLAIRLTRMGKPLLRLTSATDCARQQYILNADVTLDWGHGEAREPYVSWSSFPVDTNFIVQSSESGGQSFWGAAALTPNSALRTPNSTTYYVYADYHEAPMCPVTDSVRLNPLVVPQAEVTILPEAMSYDRLGFDAWDVTHAAPRSVSPDSMQVWQRHWYIDSVLQANSSQHLVWEVSGRDVDSVVVWLSVYNGQCHDTAVRVVPVLRRALFAPNVFTPAEESNNRFHIVTQGVIAGELFIYRRDGQLVYRTADYTEGWDGRDMNGRMCAQGNYIWKLHFKAVDYPDVWRTEVGSILLLK